MFHIAQCSQPARLFLNRMMAILRQCSEFGEITLDLEFKKDVNWFINYLAGTNSVFIMDQDLRSPIHVYVDGCNTG